MSKSRLQRVRDAIFEVFGETIAVTHLRNWDERWRSRPADVQKVKATIERDTFTGAKDPGQWSPKAVAVIHCESGIPNGAYEPVHYDLWFKVQDRLGKDLLVEHINAAVIGVYRQ